MEWTAYIWIIATFALFYFLLIRPQQKREKKDRQMRNSLEVGDNIVTIGGIVGKILTIKDDEITIETSADRTKLAFKKWCVQSKVESGETKE
ncbi:MAG TPA: preprotein translocase subunit YajC [Firmicutes bacterium]|nr:preprotein translocase subunit YajC [Bacillota bacterium]